MGWIQRTAVAALFIAAATPSQSPSKTFFEERLLDRAPVVVRAHFAADQSCFDVDVAAFKVTSRLRGEADDRILVLGASHLARRGKDVERLLFLDQKKSGCVYRIVDMIDLAEEADATEVFVRTFLGFSSDVDPGRRRATLKQAIKDGLGMRAEFPRKLAVREFDRLARRLPVVLTVEEIAEFAKLSQGLQGDDASRMGEALDAAEAGLMRQFAGTQAGLARGVPRQQFVRLVAEYLRDTDVARCESVLDQIATRFGAASGPFLLKVLDEPAGRARAALHLGAMQWTEAAPRLAKILAEGPADPAPFIASVGDMGSDAAVPALSRYLSTADHFEAAALALTRIGTPSARRMLDGVVAQLRRDPRQTPRVEAVERMRSEGFQKEDGDRRAEARGRYPRE